MAEPRPWASHDATSDKNAVPRVVFTEPQVAAVTLAQEKEQGLNVTAAVPIRLDRERGGARRGHRGHDIIIDNDRRVIVGAKFVGPDAGDHLHAASIAIVGEVTVDKLIDAVPALPTISAFWRWGLLEYGL